MIAIGLKPGAAEMPGKVATFAFYVIMILIIAFGPEIGIFRNVFMIPGVLMIILIAISAILTLVAFCSYIPGVAQQLRDKKAGKLDEAEAAEEEDAQ